MLKKNIILISILLAAFLSVACVCATDNLTSDVVKVDDDSFNSDYLANNVNESYNSVSTSSKSFTDLNELINDGSKFDIHLDSDYTFSSSTDAEFVDGIVISRSVNIYGDGFSINGNGQARIFNLTNYVNFYNVKFVNAYSESGSAITGSNYAAFGCTFTSNYATKMGGAIHGGYAKNCIFEDNSAVRWGGAVYSANIENCTFIRNSAEQGGALYNTYATLSKFINNTAGLYGGAMYGSSVSSSVFIGNYAKSHAGAVFNAYVLQCNFTNNTAANGGALGGESYSAQNCIFEYNHADDGGAMYGGTASECIFRYNYAHQGGAKFSGSASYCIFEYNQAVYGGALMESYAIYSNFTYNSAIKGGAMYHDSAKYSNFMFNSAVNGGAMFNSYSDSCKFYNNTASDQGGAIDEGGAASSEFRYNHATNGGAVSGSTGGSNSVSLCTFYDNVADEYGGAAYKTASVSCLFTRNIAKYGGAMAYGSASGCTFRYNTAKVTGGAEYEAYVADTVECNGNTPEYVLMASDFTGIEGFGGDIKIQLYDNPSYPVTGVNATIKVYNSKNKLIGTYLSEVGYNWFVNFAAGKYKARISVSDEIYELDDLTININIQKSSFIYVANVVTNYQAGKVLVVNLHDAAGNVLKNAKISVKLNGATKSYTTDDHGQVMVPTKTLAPGTYTATISYAGSDTYMKSSASAKITVKKLTPKLTAAKATFKLKDKTKKYTVTLKTNKNVVMKNTKVKITVNKKTYSVKTNSKGQAIFKLTKLTKKGTYSAVVKYAGSSIYNSLSKTVKIKVK